MEDKQILMISKVAMNDDLGSYADFLPLFVFPKTILGRF